MTRKKGPAPRNNRRRLHTPFQGLLESDPLRGIPREQEQDRDNVDHGVSPSSFGYFERLPRSWVPSGGHRSGRRLEPVEVPQDGPDESDEGRSDPAIGPDRTREEGLDGHAAGVLIAQIALQVWVVDARPSRVRILGHHQIRWHPVLFRSHVRLCDVHGGSRPLRGLERHIGAPVNLLSERPKSPRGERFAKCQKSPLEVARPGGGIDSSLQGPDVSNRRRA